MSAQTLAAAVAAGVAAACTAIVARRLAVGADRGGRR